jgi:hypothetical protein
MYFAAAIGPIDTPDRQLYASAEEARSALVGELKRLRAENLGDAEDVNGVIDEVEVSGEDFYTIFYLDGREWSAWYHGL